MDTVSRQDKLEARLTDMIEILNDHLADIAAAMTHMSKGTDTQLQDAHKQNERLRRWREREARKP